MRKNWKKWMALLTAGSLLVATPAVFSADESGNGEIETVAAAEAPEEAVQEAPAEEKQEAAAEEKAETPAEEKTEAPAETKEEAEKADDQKDGSASAEETEKSGEAEDTSDKSGEDEAASGEASEEKTGEDGAEKSEDAAGTESTAEGEKTDAADSTEETAESTSSEAEKPEEKPEEKKVEQFTGSVRVERVGGGDIYEGDAVTLQAAVENANRSDYTIVWQAKASSKWVTLDEGSATYTFAADETKLGHTYRVVLRFAENGVNDAASNELALPAMKEKPAADESAMKVEISSSAKQQMTEGDIVVLTSTISGFDGYEVMYQWSCDKGSGFQEVPGANGSTYEFTATQESLSWDWKVDVYYR